MKFVALTPPTEKLVQIENVLFSNLVPFQVDQSYAFTKIIDPAQLNIQLTDICSKVLTGTEQNVIAFTSERFINENFHSFCKLMLSYIQQFENLLQSYKIKMSSVISGLFFDFVHEEDLLSANQKKKSRIIPVEISLNQIFSRLETVQMTQKGKIGNYEFTVKHFYQHEVYSTTFYLMVVPQQDSIELIQQNFLFLTQINQLKTISSQVPFYFRYKQNQLKKESTAFVNIYNSDVNCIEKCSYLSKIHNQFGSSTLQQLQKQVDLFELQLGEFELKYDDLYQQKIYRTRRQQKKQILQVISLYQENQMTKKEQKKFIDIMGHCISPKAEEAVKDENIQFEFTKHDFQQFNLDQEQIQSTRIQNMLNIMPAITVHDKRKLIREQEKLIAKYKEKLELTHKMVHGQLQKRQKVIQEFKKEKFAFQDDYDDYFSETQAEKTMSSVLVFSPGIGSQKIFISSKDVRRFREYQIQKIFKKENFEDYFGVQVSIDLEWAAVKLKDGILIIPHKQLQDVLKMM